MQLLVLSSLKQHRRRACYKTCYSKFYGIPEAAVGKKPSLVGFTLLITCFCKALCLLKKKLAKKTYFFLSLFDRELRSSGPNSYIMAKATMVLFGLVLMLACAAIDARKSREWYCQMESDYYQICHKDITGKATSPDECKCENMQFVRNDGTCKFYLILDLDFSYKGSLSSRK